MMGREALGGLLQVFGGGMRGGFQGWEKSLQEDAIKRRDENLARLRGEADKRQHGYRMTEIKEQDKLLGKRLEASDIRGHGYRMKEIEKQDELARGRIDIEFKKNEILYRRRRDEEDTTYNRRVDEEEKRYQRRLQEGREERKAAIAERLQAIEKEVKLKGLDKLEIERQYDFLEKKFGKDKADTLIIGSMIKTAKDSPGELAKTYSEIYNEYLTTLSGGVSPTEEQKREAAKYTNTLFAAMGITKRKTEKEGTEKIDYFAELQKRSSIGGQAGGEVEAVDVGESLTGLRGKADIENQPLLKIPEAEAAEPPEGLLGTEPDMSAGSLKPGVKDPAVVQKINEVYDLLRKDAEAGELEPLSRTELLLLVSKYGPEILEGVTTINQLWRKVQSLKK